MPSWHGRADHRPPPRQFRPSVALLSTALVLGLLFCAVAIALDRGHEPSSTGLVPVAAEVGPGAPAAPSPALPPSAAAAQTARPPGGSLIPTAAPVAPTSTAPTNQVTIRTTDGTTLTAITGVPSGGGAHPLVVIPAAWGFQDTSMQTQVDLLVQRGYAAVAYTTRGFYGSGGTVDVAGPLDVSDVSDVITWASKHVAVVGNRIGVAGLSYGGGIALLAAAADTRIRAVASLSGWVDFGMSLYDANTRHKAALDLMTSLQEKSGRSSAEFRGIVDDYRAFRNMPRVLSWARTRGATAYLDRFNARRPAVFMSTSYSDGYFPPASQLAFFDRLTGPKTIRLSPGDHATNEIGGLFGIPNETWTAAWAWFDRFLIPTSAAARGPAPAPVRLLTDGGAVETYQTVAGITGDHTTLRLGPAVLGTGQLSASAPTGDWSTTFSADADTTANAGTILVTKFLEGITHRPDGLDLGTVDRKHGAVWQAAPTFASQQVRGAPELRLTVTPNSDAGTLVGYLYDTDAQGRSTLIAKAVDSYQEATPNVALPVRLTFDPVAHDLAFGHRLSLVVDTRDALFYDMNRADGTATISSPAGSPSELVVPLA
ncbi:putative acyl esterase [Frankia torreyi]|uniref:Putative acyl esterase n=1 Tax=Frankia torreyi TaxID=1856 RepID=A0A0D8B5M0_9ACTN|nr:putative acyl esterase [Frankia torreyi]